MSPALGLPYVSLTVPITWVGWRRARWAGHLRPGAAVSALGPIAWLHAPHLVAWLVTPIRALIGRGLAAVVDIAPDAVDPEPFLRSGVWDIVAWGCAIAAGFGLIAVVFALAARPFVRERTAGTTDREET